MGTLVTEELVSADLQQPTSVPNGVARSTAASQRRSYLAGLTTIVVAYLIAYGVFLAYTDGLPYVYDNNESFSSLWHAHNLYYFGIENSAGLTDEAYGPDPAAHPFVHTHQGNFPRLFAFLIFALGARSVESQILVTTFTVGLLALVTMYHYLQKTARPLFAVVMCFVLFSDYLGYAQWHVVTYRVWHLLFFFGALLCVRSIDEAWPRRWIVLMSLLYLGLFYFELVFAVFTAVTTGLYTAWVHRRRIATVVRLWVIQGVSAAASLTVLVIQLSTHLGWDVFVADMYLTFFARNSAGEPSEQIDRLRSFFETQNIVFFYNVIDVTGFRSISKFLEIHFLWHLQSYSPLLVVLMVMLVGGWLVGHLTWRGTGQPAAFPRWPNSGEGRAIAMRFDWRLRLVELHGAFKLVVHPGEIRGASLVAVSVVVSVLSLAVLGGASAFLTITTFRDNAVFGFTRAEGSYVALTHGSALIPSGLAALVIVALAIRLGLWTSWCLGLGAIVRTLLATLFVVAMTWMIRSHASLYDPVYLRPIWYEAITLWPPTWISRLAVLAAAMIALTCILGSSRGVLGRRNHLGGVIPYLVVTAIGYVTVYLLSPGYVFSGYLVRGAPLFVFLTGICFGIALFVPIAIAMKYVPEFVAMIRADAAWVRSRRPQQIRLNGRLLGGRPPLRLKVHVALAGLTYIILALFIDTGGIFANAFRASPTAIIVLNAALFALAYGTLGLVVQLAGMAFSAARGMSMRGIWPMRAGRIHEKLESGLEAATAAGRLFLGAASFGLVVYMVAYWGHMQTVYFEILPPTHFGFLKMLADPPYRGASFAVSTYAAPIAAYTGQWAYFSPTMASAEVTLTEAGFRQQSDPDAYVWLADRRTNPAYTRPDYFMCVRLQQPPLGLGRLTGRYPDGDACSRFPIVQKADTSGFSYLDHRVVARDSSPADIWVIMKMDWDFAPYLLMIGDVNTPRVEAWPDNAAEPRSVIVRYRFAHQEGKPEHESILRLVRRRADGTHCVIAERTGGDRLTVPDVAGDVFVIVVPRTATKSGPEYASAVFSLGEEQAAVPTTCLR